MYSQMVADASYSRHCIVLSLSVTSTQEFDVLLTVNLSIILVTDQLNAQILVFLNKFIIFLYMFRALLCSSSLRSKLYYTASGIVTPVDGRQVRRCTPDGHLQSVMIPDAV